MGPPPGNGPTSSCQAHTLDFSGGGGRRKNAKGPLGPQEFATFLSLLCALLLQVCYCLQGYLSLLGLLP